VKRILERVEYEKIPFEANKGNFNRRLEIRRETSRDHSQEITRDKEQFCAYIKEYKFNMFRLAKSILQNDSDAEDATSEAILKAYDNLGNLRSSASFKPWILKIVSNEAYLLAKRRKKVIYLEDIEISEEQTSYQTGELWSFVNTLSEEFRAITVLYYYEDLSVRDIAKILNLPMGTVKSRLARARQKLKVLLSEEGSMER
jgi:RNA polymerase sigma-70 factor, ECF subfamily